MITIRLVDWWNDMNMNQRRTILIFNKKNTIHAFTRYEHLPKDVLSVINNYYTTRLKMLGLTDKVRVI